MSEKRFQKTRIIDKWGGIYDSETDEILNVNDVEHKLNEQQSTINRQSEQHKQILNELINENSELRMKIVSLENEVQRQTNELKNTRKELIKKTEEINWLKPKDYLKDIEGE